MSSLRKFTPEEHSVWRELFARQAPLRDFQLVPQFSAGLEVLGITGERIPELEAVNRRLRMFTGFEGVPVQGLEGPESFFSLLSRRKFPIGNFIRDAKDLSYTPAPDVFHDLYGHIPFLVEPRYAEFCRRFGEIAARDIAGGGAAIEWERLFWFTIEFGLVRTARGLRVFGAGIASSHAECAYALSDRPEVVPFDLERIRAQEYRIDRIQPKLFVLENPEQLYSSIEALEALAT